MPKYTVQELKFKTPISELGPKVGNTTILGPYTNGWTATADEDLRVILLKIKGPDGSGKVTTKTYRVPFEAVQFYQVTAAAVKDAAGEPPDPK